MFPNIRRFIQKSPHIYKRLCCSQKLPKKPLGMNKFQHHVAEREFIIFTPKFLMKYKETLPIVFVMVFLCCAVPTYSIYMAQTRPDVNFTKKRDVAPEEHYDVMNPKPRKNITFNQHYEPLPDLAAALEYRKEYKKD